MKNTFKMSALALSLGLMSSVSSCEKPKPTTEGADTAKTVIEPKVDTTVKTPVDTSTSATTTK
jgi:hypothetical protein